MFNQNLRIVGYQALVIPQCGVKGALKGGSKILVQRQEKKKPVKEIFVFKVLYKINKFIFGRKISGFGLLFCWAYYLLTYKLGESSFNDLVRTILKKNEIICKIYKNWVHFFAPSRFKRTAQEYSGAAPDSVVSYSCFSFWEWATGLLSCFWDSASGYS